mmetsp:Transcript_47594/g.111279  ORF Transcript_47594/g.111279 Transcript_47594/m.111279 type:complete len:214 (+) Transcript_47594:237-878(+)
MLGIADALVHVLEVLALVVLSLLHGLDQTVEELVVKVVLACEVLNLRIQQVLADECAVIKLPDLNKHYVHRFLVVPGTPFHDVPQNLHVFVEVLTCLHGLVELLADLVLDAEVPANVSDPRIDRIRWGLDLLLFLWFHHVIHHCSHVHHGHRVHLHHWHAHGIHSHATHASHHRHAHGHSHATHAGAHAWAHTHVAHSHGHAGAHAHHGHWHT